VKNGNNSNLTAIQENTNNDNLYPSPTAASITLANYD